MADYYDRDGNPTTVHEWARRFEDTRYKRIAYDETPSGDISTVWLGLDHRFDDGPPLIFETIVFDRDSGNDDNEMRRYATEDEARAGHAELLSSR